MFFFKKEPKTLALRGYINHNLGQYFWPDGVLFQKEPKTLALRGYIVYKIKIPELVSRQHRIQVQILGEADPGGLGACPQEMN
jgi:hypothetical protein